MDGRASDKRMIDKAKKGPSNASSSYQASINESTSPSARSGFCGASTTNKNSRNPIPILGEDGAVLSVDRNSTKYLPKSYAKGL
jgi:hypothetical protein